MPFNLLRSFSLAQDLCAESRADDEADTPVKKNKKKINIITIFYHGLERERESDAT